jgi:hypothetical protein
MKSNKITSLLIFVISLTIANNSYSQEYKTSKRPDDHAPIGVMRDHIHKKGEIMTSYRFLYMKMKGLRNEDNKVSTSDALSRYIVAPTKMTMKMHMIGAMYGITDQLTLSAMGSFVEKNMDHIHRATGEFNRETDDIGDTKINALYEFYNKDANRFQFNLGLSLPTGNIDKKYDGTRLPYPMQIGSGSYELLPGISYSGHQDNLSYGGQINGIFRLNTNDNGYKLGDQYNITSWVARKLNNSFSVLSRLDYNKNEAIEGRDSSLDKMVNMNMNPTAKTSLQDQERLDLLFGVNFLMQKGFLEGNRLAVEFGAPIYQRIDGPMLENDYKITIGWQNKF